MIIKRSTSEHLEGWVRLRQCLWPDETADEHRHYATSLLNRPEDAIGYLACDGDGSTVAFVEATCIEALAPYLEADEGTVGTQINMSHVAATPIGMSVTARVELVTMERRQLLFRVVCRDAKDMIGEGLHERFIINRPAFMARTESKLALAEC